MTAQVMVATRPGGERNLSVAWGLAQELEAIGIADALLRNVDSRPYADSRTHPGLALGIPADGHLRNSDCRFGLDHWRLFRD